MVDWLVLAAHYPPHAIGGGEMSDHAILAAAAAAGVRVTVLVESGRLGEYTLDGVTVRSRFIRPRRLNPHRLLISGTPTIPSWLRRIRSSLTVLLRAPGSLPWLAPLAGRLDSVIVPSPWFAGQVAAAYPSLQSKTVVSYPALDLRLDERRPVPQRRFITLASAERHKGLETFLALSARYAGREWLVADNLHPDAAAALRRRLPVYPNLSLLTKHESMTQVYFLSDLLLLPSVPGRHVETFGRVAAEALAWGVLPLAYNLGGPADWLPPGCLIERDESSRSGQLRLWRQAIDHFTNPANEMDRRQLIIEGQERLRGLHLSTAAHRLVASLLD